MNLLARRDYSQRELTQKLRSKGYDAAAIATVIMEYAESGLINEQRLVEHFIHWRRQKGYGPERIAAELKERGITAEMIAEHLEIADNDWLIEVRKTWQKHFKNKPPGDYKTKAKQMRFLQYKGYTRDQIESVFENLPATDNE